jgi:hypothetical protein
MKTTFLSNIIEIKVPDRNGFSVPMSVIKCPYHVAKQLREKDQGSKYFGIDVKVTVENVINWIQVTDPRVQAILTMLNLNRYRRGYVEIIKAVQLGRFENENEYDYMLSMKVFREIIDGTIKIPGCGPGCRKALKAAYDKYYQARRELGVSNWQ